MRGGSPVSVGASPGRPENRDYIACVPANRVPGGMTGYVKLAEDALGVVGRPRPGAFDQPRTNHMAALRLIVKMTTTTMTITTTVAAVLRTPAVMSAP